MKDWKQDKRWADRFMPEIKQILGLHLIGEATREEDVFRNTDLIVLKMEAVRIACRVRRPGYVNIYSNEFTIRSSRPNGTKTELTKIIEGWGDYLFYAHAGESTLSLWHLCNLNVFRLWYNRYLAAHSANEYPGEKHTNKDGSSEFYAFSFSDLPEEFIVAKR